MFEILEHPSDVGILARASTRDEALLELSRGLVSIIIDTDGFGSSEERDFRASGIDETAQIVNWLNEILFFFDTEGFVPLNLNIHSWTDNEIVGHATGGLFDPSRHEFRTAVKAATYHQFESHATSDGWEIRAYVDV
jgi:SHS2 domain-containing protein